MEDLVPVEEACKWATAYLHKSITRSSISYLVQYGKISKHDAGTSSSLVSITELKQYYDNNVLSKKADWKKQLGDDLNWHLSFDQLRELDTTKHVHRLHPYKGKYIPQLVEYFLDQHVDEFKRMAFFKPGDIVIDPFMGSGTTLVESGELGLHGIGVDISLYNCMIVGAKVARYDAAEVKRQLAGVLEIATIRIRKIGGQALFKEIKGKIHEFNKTRFAGVDFKRRIVLKEINEDEYGEAQLGEFLANNNEVVERLRTMKAEQRGENDDGFMHAWFNASIQAEFNVYRDMIEAEPDATIKNLLRIIVSRTARACRSTRHFDLATLKEPQVLPYYCWKHKKLCAPVESSFPRFKNYIADTMTRIETYARLRKDVELVPVNGDSRTVDVVAEVRKQNAVLGALLETRKIDGLFSSPPYVGQIDYHEQHAYAYEMFDIQRADDKEIGPLSKGESNKAKEDYVLGISAALVNLDKFIKDDGDIFLVANDKYGLYHDIARRSKLAIVNQYKRPVMNRTERDRQPYAEIIFHMKKKKNDTDVPPIKDHDGHVDIAGHPEPTRVGNKELPKKTVQTKLFPS